jgi:hypothetical protein
MKGEFVARFSNQKTGKLKKLMMMMMLVVVMVKWRMQTEMKLFAVKRKKFS